VHDEELVLAVDREVVSSNDEGVLRVLLDRSVQICRRWVGGEMIDVLSYHIPIKRGESASR
jgi:hypothetical protein